MVLYQSGTGTTLITATIAGARGISFVRITVNIVILRHASPTGSCAGRGTSGALVSAVTIAALIVEKCVHQTTLLTHSIDVDRPADEVVTYGTGIHATVNVKPRSAQTVLQPSHQMVQKMGVRFDADSRAEEKADQRRILKALQLRNDMGTKPSIDETYN